LADVELLERVKRFVRKMRKSPKLQEELASAQELLEMPKNMLIRDMEVFDLIFSRIFF
jgi:hypothetical protein